MLPADVPALGVWHCPKWAHWFLPDAHFGLWFRATLGTAALLALRLNALGRHSMHATGRTLVLCT